MVFPISNRMTFWVLLYNTMYKNLKLTSFQYIRALRGFGVQIVPVPDSKYTVCQHFCSFHS